MAQGDIYVGLDIGTTKVATVVAEAGSTPGEISILGVGVAPSTGIRRGVVVDIEETAQAIRQSVAQAQASSGAEVHSVVIGVTGEHIASLNSRGIIAITNADREVRREDMERVLENARVIVLPPDREIIHVVPRGFSLDGQGGIRNPVGMAGTRLEVETHIVTGATSFLQNAARCVEQAGLRVDDVVLEPLATAASVLMPAERNLGVALLDIGGGTSDLAIFLDGEVCHTAVIPVGGAYVTNDIAVCLRTDLEEAERIKREYAATGVLRFEENDTFSYRRICAVEETSEELSLLHDIVDARMTELFQMVRAEINRSNYGNHLSAGMVLSGGGATLRGTLNTAESQTLLPCRLGTPSGIGGRAELVAHPSFATGVGLVQWACRTQAEPVFSVENPLSLLAAIRSWIRRVWGGTLRSL